MRRRAVFAMVATLLGACEGGLVVGGSSDASVPLDASAALDAGPGRDAGQPPEDAGTPLQSDGGSAGSDAGPAHAACPPPSPLTIDATLEWDQVLQHRMASEAIASFPVLAAPNGWATSVFTQGQQPSTPAGVVTEFYVSRCRGAIVPPPAGVVDRCYYRSVFVNNNQIAVFTRPVNGWDSQETLGDRGCWAPASEGTWYVNVRWTYETCPFASCGFSLQWALGAW